MKQNYYEWLAENEKENLPDSRLEPIHYRHFQLKLLEILTRHKIKDFRVKTWKGSVVSGRRNLTSKEKNTLKKIFIDFFYNKDPETYSDPLPHIYRKLDTTKRKHYLCVENPGS